MKRRAFLFASLALAALPVTAAEDPGKEVVAKVTLTVYYATNSDAAAAGTRAVSVPKEMIQRFEADPRLKFSSYRQIGKDTKPLYRSYENWAQPLPPSDEILLRFEAQSLPEKGSVRLDLEFWLSRKKILKTDAPVASDRPLLVLGPEWRGGRLILAIELAPAPPAP